MEINLIRTLAVNMFCVSLGINAGFVPILISQSSNDSKVATIYDGFESCNLSRNWQTRKFVADAVQIQSVNVREGKSAAKITLRPGNQIPQESDSELERAELLESKELWAAE